MVGPGADADVVDLDLQLSGNGCRSSATCAASRRRAGGRRLHQDVTRDTTVRAIGLGALSYVSKSKGEVHLVAPRPGGRVGDPYTPPALTACTAPKLSIGRPCTVLGSREADVQATSPRWAMVSAYTTSHSIGVM